MFRTCNRCVVLPSVFCLPLLFLFQEKACGKAEQSRAHESKVQSRVAFIACFGYIRLARFTRTFGVIVRRTRVSRLAGVGRRSRLIGVAGFRVGWFFRVYRRLFFVTL